MGIPQNIEKALVLYRSHHIKPGSFSLAMLAGDYETALMRADPVSRAAIEDIKDWIASNIPADARDSTGNVSAWLGMAGGRLTLEDAPPPMPGAF